MEMSAPHLMSFLSLLNVLVLVSEQEQVSGGTTSTVLRNLLSDTVYTVSVVPVYPEGVGLPQSGREKTRECNRLNSPTFISPRQKERDRSSVSCEIKQCFHKPLF